MLIVLFTCRDFCSSGTTSANFNIHASIRVKRVFGSSRFRHAEAFRKARVMSNQKPSARSMDAAPSEIAGDRVDFANNRRGWTRLKTPRGRRLARAGSRSRLVRWKAAWEAAAGRGPAPRGNVPQPKRGAGTPRRRDESRRGGKPAQRNRLRRAKIFRSSSTWPVSSSIGICQKRLAPSLAAPACAARPQASFALA